MRRLRILHPAFKILLVSYLGLISPLALSHALNSLTLVLNSQDGSISLIDPSNFSEVSRLNIKRTIQHCTPESSSPRLSPPHLSSPFTQLQASPDDQIVALAHPCGNELILLNPRDGQVQDRIKQIPHPFKIAFSPDQKWLLVTSLQPHQVRFYAHSQQDGKYHFQLIKTLPLNETPGAIVFNSTGSLAWVALQNWIAAIDLATQTIQTILPTMGKPAGLWIAPDDRYLIAAMAGQDHLDAIDLRTHKVFQHIKVAQDPLNLIGVNFHNAQKEKYLLVTSPGSDRVTQIDAYVSDPTQFKVIHQWHIPGAPHHLKLSADGRWLWISLKRSNQIAVIDMSQQKIIAQIPVGRAPTDLYFLDHD